MGSDEKSTEGAAGETTAGADPMTEFMAAADAMNAGMSDIVSSALRLQMLMLEDAQSMMAELGAVCAAAAQHRPEDESDG